jgi:hypothetical protein
MKPVRRGKQWFVEGVEPYIVDGEVCTSWGPYETKAEAIADMRGVERTLRKWKPPAPAAEPEPVDVQPVAAGDKQQLLLF